VLLYYLTAGIHWYLAPAKRFIYY